LHHNPTTLLGAPVPTIHDVVTATLPPDGEAIDETQLVDDVHDVVDGDVAPHNETELVVKT